MIIKTEIANNKTAEEKTEVTLKPQLRYLKLSKLKISTKFLLIIIYLT